MCNNNRSIFQRPGFWIGLGIFILLMTCILLPADGNCEMIVSDMVPDVTWEENTEQYGEYLYTVRIKTSCSVAYDMSDGQLLLEDVCSVGYYHFIGETEETQILTLITSDLPTPYDLKINLGFYMLALEEGV